MKKIKVLQVGAENFGFGGRSMIAYNLAKNMDSKLVENDFLAYRSPVKSKYVEEINKQGKVIFVDFHNKPFLYKEKKLINIVKENSYDIVHIHADHAYEAFKSAILAKMGGAKKIIIHAHNSRDKKYSFLKQNVIALSQKLLPILSDENFACTNEAGNYLYGNYSKFKIIKDGIDIDKYKFNNQIRISERKKLHLDNRLVIGSVGRLTYQKNPEFTLQIFSKFINKFPNIDARLLMIGDGELRSNLEKKVRELNLASKVNFLGNREDVPKLMQAMDVLIFPSRYEGFGMVAIEAQAASLPIIVSTNVPKETKMLDSLYYRLPLNNSFERWSQQIQRISMQNKRKDTSYLITKKGYSIKEIAKEVENEYVKLIQN